MTGFAACASPTLSVSLPLTPCVSLRVWEADGADCPFPHCQQICDLLGLNRQLIYVQQIHLIFLLRCQRDAATAGFLSPGPLWG